MPTITSDKSSGQVKYVTTSSNDSFEASIIVGRNNNFIEK